VENHGCQRLGPKIVPAFYCSIHLRPHFAGPSSLLPAHDLIWMRRGILKRVFDFGITTGS
jgi:hypothetical protein